MDDEVERRPRRRGGGSDALLGLIWRQLVLLPHCKLESPPTHPPARHGRPMGHTPEVCPPGSFPSHEMAHSKPLPQVNQTSRHPGTHPVWLRASTPRTCELPAIAAAWKTRSVAGRTMAGWIRGGALPAAAIVAHQPRVSRVSRPSRSMALRCCHPAPGAPLPASSEKPEQRRAGRMSSAADGR
jgi:hypothetical protein